MKRALSIVVCGSLAMLGMASAARADHYREIDALAHQIEDQAVRVQREAVHFRGLRQYGHFVRDAASIRRLAAHVRHEIDHGRRIHHIRHDAEALHREVTHMERLVDAMWHQACPGSRLEYELEHVQRVIGRLERAVRHIERHLDELDCHYGAASRPAAYRRYAQPPRPVIYRTGSHFGVTVGGGRVQFHIGF